MAFLACCLTEVEIHQKQQEALGTERLQQVAVVGAGQMTAVAPLPAVRLPSLWKPARQLKLIDALVAEGVGVSRGLAWGRLWGLQLKWMWCLQRQRTTVRGGLLSCLTLKRDVLDVSKNALVLLLQPILCASYCKLWYLVTAVGSA